MKRDLWPYHGLSTAIERALAALEAAERFDGNEEHYRVLLRERDARIVSFLLPVLPTWACGFALVWGAQSVEWLPDAAPLGLRVRADCLCGAGGGDREVKRNARRRTHRPDAREVARGGGAARDHRTQGRLTGAALVGARGRTGPAGPPHWTPRQRNAEMTQHAGGADGGKNARRVRGEPPA